MDGVGGWRQVGGIIRRRQVGNPRAIISGQTGLAILAPVSLVLDDVVSVMSGLGGESVARGVLGGLGITSAHDGFGD